MTAGALTRFKAMLLEQATHAHGFMRLLMKPRNGQPWSAEDKAALRFHLKRFAEVLPALGVFSLPGGALLLPLLAWYLDRRRARRAAESPAEIERRARQPLRAGPSQTRTP